MPSDHNPKYRVTKWDGTPLPEGEPVFVLRGQDVFAVPTLINYRAMLVVAGYGTVALEHLDEHIDEMLE